MFLKSLEGCAGGSVSFRHETCRIQCSTYGDERTLTLDILNATHLAKYELRGEEFSLRFSYVLSQHNPQLKFNPYIRESALYAIDSNRTEIWSWRISCGDWHCFSKKLEYEVPTTMQVQWHESAVRIVNIEFSYRHQGADFLGFILLNSSWVHVRNFSHDWDMSGEYFVFPEHVGASSMTTLANGMDHALRVDGRKVTTAGKINLPMLQVALGSWDAYTTPWPPGLVRADPPFSLPFNTIGVAVSTPESRSKLLSLPTLQAGEKYVFVLAYQRRKYCNWTSGVGSLFQGGNTFSLRYQRYYLAPSPFDIPFETFEYPFTPNVTAKYVLRTADIPGPKPPPTLGYCLAYNIIFRERDAPRHKPKDVEGSELCCSHSRLKSIDAITTQQGEGVLTQASDGTLQLWNTQRERNSLETLLVPSTGRNTEFLKFSTPEHGTRILSYSRLEVGLEVWRLHAPYSPIYTRLVVIVLNFFVILGVIAYVYAMVRSCRTGLLNNKAEVLSLTRSCLASFGLRRPYTEFNICVLKDYESLRTTPINYGWIEITDGVNLHKFLLSVYLVFVLVIFMPPLLQGSSVSGSGNCALTKEKLLAVQEAVLNEVNHYSALLQVEKADDILRDVELAVRRSKVPTSRFYWPPKYEQKQPFLSSFYNRSRYTYFSSTCNGVQLAATYRNASRQLAQMCEKRVSCFEVYDGFEFSLSTIFPWFALNSKVKSRRHCVPASGTK